MKCLSRSLIAASLILIPSTGTLAASPAEPTWEAVDKVLGRPGKLLPGDVHRYGWPRTDLRVTTGGVQVEPALALGSWAGFVKTTTEGQVMTMGDLVLLVSEVGPVVRALQAGGLDVLAVHNHLMGESPQVIYVHFSGHGDAQALAKALRSALDATKTPSTRSKPSSEGRAPWRAASSRSPCLGRRRSRRPAWRCRPTSGWPPP